jgi:hypothetical protein
MLLLKEAIVNLLFALSLFEKKKSNIVHESKVLYLFLPSFSSILLGLGASLNFRDYIDGGYVDKDSLAFSILLFTGSIFALIVIIIYKRTIIRYDNEKLLYRGKWYKYDQICSLGNNKNDYVFVLKDGKKIKFSILAVGSNELCKAYLDYKKQHKKDN